MRDVVLYALLSLDGVAEEPGDWMSDVDDEVFDNLVRVIATQDDVLLGRGTYEYWVDYWPTSDVQPFANFINTTPKHVVTSRHLDLSWPQTLVADLPLTAYVTQLGKTVGRDIGVHGSIQLGRELLAADLVDRVELVVVPALAGSGRRLLTETGSVRRLTLTTATPSSTGCVFLSYRRPRASDSERTPAAARS